MHASLTAQPLSAGPVRPMVDVFGDVDETEAAPRVAVQLTIHLTFAEILGRLMFSSGFCLSRDDLAAGDEDRVRIALWFAVTDVSLYQAEDFAEMAMDIYTGRRASNLQDFAHSLGHVITHIFGVTAPEPPASAIPGLPLASYSEALIGHGGMRV